MSDPNFAGSKDVIDIANNRFEELSHTLEVMQARFDALGGAATLGEPNQERPDLWSLGDGSVLVYNDKSDAAFHIRGAICTKWRELGAELVPETDERPTVDTVGRFNHFRDGHSIYWHPDTGAWHAYGAVRIHWESLGWETGYLGYPTSDEVDFADGGRASAFQGGAIYWWSDTGAIDLKGVNVTYAGAFCFEEADADHIEFDDTIYLTFGVWSPAGPATIQTDAVGNVDSGENVPALVPLYSGAPVGLTISATLSEEDFGGKDEHRKLVEDAMDRVHEAGAAGLATIPYVGLGVAAIVVPIMGKYVVPAMKDGINNAIADDTLGTTELILSGRDLVLQAAWTPTQTKGEIIYRLESGGLTRRGSNYRLYFGIEPL